MTAGTSGSPRQSAGREADSGLSWIFFASHAKPVFMCRALPERLAAADSVVVVAEPLSVLRRRRAPPLRERSARVEGYGRFWQYRPLHYPVGIPGFGPLFRLLNRRLLRSELDSLLPRGSRRIACYDSPHQYDLVKHLGETGSIYLAIDDRTLTVRGEPIGGELAAERRLLRAVEAVVCVSEPLAESLRSRVPAGRSIPIQVLPNGYDERLFDPGRAWAEPAVLHALGKPRVLVAGHVSERIDWDGIESASRLRPDWTWVFLGPADAGIPEKIRLLGSQPGRLVWHPPVAVSEVPAWIAHCEAGAVPYRLNSFTRASSPLKAVEYLAMGAPVLSTRVPALDRYHDAIRWVEEGDGASYARVLDEILASPGDSGARIAAAREESWASKAMLFRAMSTRAGTGLAGEVR